MNYTENGRNGRFFVVYCKVELSTSTFFYYFSPKICVFA